MISPSRGPRPHHLGALVLWPVLVGTGTATAQDTLQIAQLGQQPGVHVVQQGETLWTLAGRYLGDPLLWPEIYRLNTLVVEDPHWIFPGEELRLADFVPPPVVGPGPEPDPGVPVTVAGPPGQTPEGTPGMPGQTIEQPGQPIVPTVEAPPPPPVPPPPPPTTESSPTVFMTTEGVRRPGDMGGIVGRWHPVRRGEFYAAGFLTENQDLPWAEVLGAVGKPTLANLSASSSQRVHGEIEIRAPGGAEYRVGDSLLVARQGRNVSGGWGKVIVPTAIARVTRVRDRDVTAVIVEQFERVADGQRALPLEPFRDPGQVVPVPVEDGMMARVVARRDLNPIAGQQDIIFIDVGREDGIALGDVFEVLRRVATNPDGSPAYEQLGVMHVVHMRERSSSAILMYVNDIGADAGSPVRLYRKMPS